MKSVKEVSINALCHGCGICAGICPTQAISMEYNEAGFLISKVDEEKCINCGKCLRACSGKTSEINTTLKKMKGTYNGAYIGYATDEDIRMQGQSGGVITALLCYLIDSKKIDGAYVNKFNSEKNYNEMTFVTTKKELLACAGSYYCQSNATICVENPRSAAVLLGCQSESMYKAEQGRRSEKFPEYRIGLFCAGNFSNKYILDLKKKANLENANIDRFRFRDKAVGGWPGDVTMQTAEQSKTVSKEYRMKQKEYYQCFRCDLCFDRLNCFSDVAVGDPWGIECEDEKKGVSVLLTRTERGQKMVEEAAEFGYIEIEKINPELVIAGQSVDEELVKANEELMNISKRNGWATSFDNSQTQSSYVNKKREAMLKYHREIYFANSEDDFWHLVDNRKKINKKNNILQNMKMKMIKILRRVK